MNTAIAVVLKGYPRLSETFIAQELLALERKGLTLHIVSLRRPTEDIRHPAHEQIQAPVRYLPEYLHDEPIRVLRAWKALRQCSGYRRARAVWRHDLARDRSINRVRRFGQALVLAHELEANIRHLYAHFLHTPATVARYAGLIRGLPISISAHAKDIWTLPAWEKREKLAAAAWTVTCTACNHQHLQQLSADPSRVALVYHGIDRSRFPPSPNRGGNRNGTHATDPVRLLSVGRLVIKKGYTYLLQALALLPRELHWRLTHIGAGPLATPLKQQSLELGLHDRIDWHGSQSQAQVMAAYANNDLFALASVIAADGDRDGLPNVLLEAQYMALPVVATRVSAITELIQDQVNGLLVEPANISALAQALENLIRDPERRSYYGANGRERVQRLFSFEDGIDFLYSRLRTATTPPA